MPHYDRSERGGEGDGVFIKIVTDRWTGVVGLLLMAAIAGVSLRVVPPYLPPAPDGLGLVALGFQVAWYGVLGLVAIYSLQLAVRGRTIEVAVRDGTLCWVDGSTGKRSGSVPVKDVRTVRVFHTAPDRSGGRPELECVMIERTGGPTVLLPRNVAHAAASEEFMRFLTPYNQAVTCEVRTVSDARELHELRNRVIRMRAARSHRTT